MLSKAMLLHNKIFRYFFSRFFDRYLKFPFYPKVELEKCVITTTMQKTFDAFSYPQKDDSVHLILSMI